MGEGDIYMKFLFPGLSITKLFSGLFLSLLLISYIFPQSKITERNNVHSINLNRRVTIKYPNSRVKKIESYIKNSEGIKQQALAKTSSTIPNYKNLASTSGSYTFASFNTGTITGGGSAYTKSLDVSSLPTSEYLFVRVTADYAPGTSPHDGYSSTMKMMLSNGSTTTYWDSSTATVGVLPAAGSTSLSWVGMLRKNSYIGGQNLTVSFKDSFTDASGPYTSALNNVSITIYPSPTPSHTFASFNTGTITGGGSAYTKSLDVSSLPTSEYLFVRVTADYAPGTSPHDGYSSTMKMMLSNGSTTTYWDSSTATVGVLPAAGSTSLAWVGMLRKNSYIGGQNLTVSFKDSFTDASGPYTSALNNVSITIYPSPTPSHTFASFNTGTITGGGSAYTKSLDVSSLPTSEYLFVRVTADYAPGTSPHDGYSSTMKMMLSNGSTTTYWDSSTATVGVLPAAGSTSLSWVGMLRKNSYIGGQNLTISFKDSFTDASGPYTSALNNVSITIYPATSIMYAISGNTGLANVTLSYTDGVAKTAISASDGSYNISIPSNWTGVITPSKTDYSFTPNNYSYSNITSDQPNKDYTAILNAPTANNASNVTQSSFSANWTLIASATNYFLDVATDTLFTNIIAGYNNLNVGNVSTYTVNSNISPNTGYYYRVRANNISGSSGNSNVMEVTSLVPVELASFSVQALLNKIKLNWNTATEVNNFGFEIERAVQSETKIKNVQHLQMIDWKKIGFVKGAGTSNSPKDYSFIDENPVGGNNFQYRLKQIDNDGTYKYSEILNVKILPSQFDLSQNYPNPFNPTTTINYEVAVPVNVTLKIYNMLGEEVATLINNQFREAGQYNVNFNASKLASGAYVYRLTAGNFVQTKKMILTK